MCETTFDVRFFLCVCPLQALLLLRFDNNSSIQSLLSDLIQSVSDIGLADPAGTGAVLAQPARGVADSTLMHLLHGIVNVRAQVRVCVCACMHAQICGMCHCMHAR